MSINSGQHQSTRKTWILLNGGYRYRDGSGKRRPPWQFKFWNEFLLKNSSCMEKLHKFTMCFNDDIKTANYENIGESFQHSLTILNKSRTFKAMSLCNRSILKKYLKLKSSWQSCFELVWFQTIWGLHWIQIYHFDIWALIFIPTR